MRRGFFLLLAGISSLLALGDRYEISLFYRYLMNIYSINSIVSFSYIFLVFYLGYTITQIPGGLFAQKFGPSKIMGLSLILWSSFLILIFILHSFIVGIIISFLMGLSQGPIYPSMMQFLRDKYVDSEYPVATSITTFFGDISPAFIFTVSVLTYQIWKEPYLSPFLLASIGIITGIALVLIRDNYNYNRSFGKLRDLVQYSEYWILGISFLSYDAFFYIFLSWYPVMERIKDVNTANSYLSYLPWIFMGLSAILFGRIMSKLNKDLQLSGISYFIILICTVIMILFAAPYVFLISSSIILALLNPILLGFWRLSSRISGSANSSIAGGWMNFWGNLGGLISPYLAAVSIEKFKLLGLMVVMLSFIILGMVTRIILGEIENED